jgi:hypothetical protein
MSPDCPFCSATAQPQLARRRYRERGLVVLGHHHKGALTAHARGGEGLPQHYRFHFPVAIDPD